MRTPARASQSIAQRPSLALARTQGPGGAEQEWQTTRAWGARQASRGRGGLVWGWAQAAARRFGRRRPAIPPPPPPYSLQSHPFGGDVEAALYPGIDATDNALRWGFVRKVYGALLPLPPAQVYALPPSVPL